MSTFFPFGIPVTSSYAESASFSREVLVTASNVQHALVAQVGLPGTPGPRATGCPPGYENALDPQNPSEFPALPAPTPTAGVDRSKYILCFPIPTPSPTRTSTPSLSVTPTVTPTPSLTRTPTVTATPSITITPSRSATPSVSPTPSLSLTPSISVSPTKTITPSLSATPSVTPTKSATPSLTITTTPTNTPSITTTPSITATPSITPTRTRTPTRTPSQTCNPSNSCYYYGVGDDDSVADACEGNDDTNLYASGCNSLLYKNSSCTSTFSGWVFTGGGVTDRYINGEFVGQTVCPSVTPTRTPTPTRSISLTPTHTPTRTLSVTPSISISPSRTPSPSIPLFSYSLTGPNLLENDACNSITFTTRYSSCSTLTVGCFLYTNTSLTTPATNGWYAASNGTSYRLTESTGEITQVDNCFN